MTTATVEFAAYLTNGKIPTNFTLPEGSHVRDNNDTYHGKVFTQTKNAYLQKYGELYASNAVMRDPNYGVYKWLYAIVQYSNGEKQIFTIKENSKIAVKDRMSPNVVSLKGDKGDKGDKGERGPQGIQGIQGIQGPRGFSGTRSSDFTSVYKTKFRAITSLYVSLNSSFLSGSGFIMKYDNYYYIITAAHNVIATYRDIRAQQIYASFHNGIEVISRKCKILGVSAYADIAVLEFENNNGINPDHPYLQWATDHPEIAEPCCILGNPLGLDEASFSQGYVRDMEYYHMQNHIESISITAPLFGGNSGGPIINIDGKVIGLINAGIGEFETFGWGISYRIAEKIVEKIIQNRSDYYVGNIGIKLMLPNGYNTMQFGISSLGGFIVRQSFINEINVGDQLIMIGDDKVGQGFSSLSEKILLQANKWIKLILRRNGSLITQWIYINQIDRNDDIPLGRFNHELKADTKSQSVTRISSRTAPMTQRKQRRGRPHRKLLLTTQE